MKDLVALVADKNMQFALDAGLKRHQSLGIRKIDFDILQHPGRDGGVRADGSELLRLQRGSYSHAVMVLDYEGSGAADSRGDLERQLDGLLERTWGDDAKAIVIEPELESWIWGSDKAIQQILDWPHRVPIRTWLADRKFVVSDQGKPDRPKEAFEAVLRECGKPRSASLYAGVVGRLSIRRCTDPALVRLRNKLKTWFGAT